MKRLLLCLLLAVFISACKPDNDEPQPPGPGPGPAPAEVTGTENGYTTEEQNFEENIPLLPTEAEIVDETLTIGLSAPPPLIYGEEIDEESREFRAATWNVRQLTMNTKENDIRLKPLGSPAPAGTVKKNEAILKVLKLYGIHIAALQEVYKPKTGGGFPLSNGEGYTILEGGAIKTNGSAADPLHFEHCPIAYRDAKLDCKSERTNDNARVHWAECTIRNVTPEKKFYFGCAHYGTTKLTLRGHVTNFFRQLNTAGLHPQVSAANRDNFIMGLDANSNPTGHEKDTWTTQHNNWKALPANAGIGNAIQFPPVNPAGTATKIYKRKNPPPEKIQVTSNAGKKVIDFLIHSLKPNEIKYKTNPVPSMQALDVRVLNSDLTGQKNWIEYHKLSDHIPVKADYTY